MITRERVVAAVLALHAIAVAAAATVSSSEAPLRLPEPGPNGGAVLVLGSAGLIGSAVTTWLRAHNYNVLEVRNRAHIDLRKPHSLDVFNASDVRFVMFLACEVGGSKFIDSKSANTQLQIIEHNVLIYQNVFDWLNDRGRVPFLFTSSYLQMLQTPYGSIKRMGEAWINSLGFGKMVRLWNVYGLERHGPKSHVLTDWTKSCAERQVIECLTDGRESRQFLFVSDCASALGTAMQHYAELEPVTDISSNLWISMREMAALIDAHAPHRCAAKFTEIRAAARARVSPQIAGVALYRYWKPTVPLSEGIPLLFAAYRNATAASPSPSPSPSAAASGSGSGSGSGSAPTPTYAGYGGGTGMTRDDL